MWNITTQINTYGLLGFEKLCFLNIFVCPLSTVTNLKLLEMKYEKEKKTKLGYLLQKSGKL